MPAPIAISGNPPVCLQGPPTEVFSGGSKHGPFENGTDQYLVLTTEDLGGNTYFFNVYKSTDAGTTWVLQDDLNAPQLLGFYTATQNGTKLELVYCGIALGFHPTSYVEFDMATDSYGAPSQAANGNPAGPLFDGNGNQRSVKLADGSYLVIYTASVDIMAGIRRSAGGVWAAAFQIVADVAPIQLQQLGICGDAASNAYLVYELRTVFVSRTLNIRRITPGNVVSAEQTINTTAPANSFRGTGPVEIFQGGIAIPVLNQTTGEVGIWFSDAVAVPATWAFQSVGPSDGNWESLTIIDATHARLWWINDTQVVFATWDGTTFGPQVVFYDYAVDPPPGGPPAIDQLLRQFTAALLLTSGDYAIAFAMEYNDPDEDYSTFYVRAGAASPSIICNDPPQGFYRVPYSHGFIASGGTPPYVSYTIVAGALPTGLTLGLTGVVSGLPIAGGTFTFTVRVTDSLGAHGDAECSIDIECPKNAQGV